MIYVTDTHPLVFYSVGQTKRLGKKALRAFTLAERGQATIHIPTVCFFELALLLESGKLRSTLSLPQWKARIEDAGSFVVESLTWGDVEEAQSLQALVDPFDRLLAGTANRLHCPLISRDRRIAGSNQVAILW